MSKNLLVTGASGHLGSRVVELLLETQAGQIIAATRTPEKLADFTNRGVQVRHADFDDPASLRQAFGGVDRLLLISTDVVGIPGHRLQQHINAVKAAEESGVKHVVYTSLTNPGPESPIKLAPDHYGTEQALENSKLGWTILRNNVYTEMLLGSLPRAIQMGKHFAAAGGGRTGYVTREDCARAAAGALTSSFEGRRILDVTGPEALSQADLAAIASKISGKPVEYVPIELETIVQAMVGAGVPRPAAETYASFDTGIAQGFLDVVSNTVEELSGKKPTSVEAFLTAHQDVLLKT